MLDQAVVRPPTPPYARVSAQLYGIASGVRMTFLGFVGDEAELCTTDISGIFQRRWTLTA